MAKRTKRTGSNGGASRPALPDSLGGAGVVSRREFLRVGGTLAAAAAIAAGGCQMPVETVVPFHERPEGLRTVGRPLFYSTVLDGVPVLVRTREGRPLLLNAHPTHPARSGPSLRTHAALLDLYDADRSKGPLSVRRSQGAPVAADWAIVGAEVTRALREKKGAVALLTRPLTGSATRAVVAELVTTLGVRHVAYEPLADDVPAAAWTACFGPVAAPVLRLDRAKVLVGFGAEFLDTPTGRAEADFAARRDPDAKEGMSRFVAFEARLSLTGANADKRVRTRDADLASLALSLAHEVVIGKRMGPLASDPTVAAALQPFAIDAVAARTGVPADFLKALAAELAAAGPEGLVVAGGTASTAPTGPALESAVHLLNLSLGSLERCFDRPPAEPAAGGALAALASLVAEMQAGRIATLIVAGPNPVYDAPASLKFSDALAKVPLVVSLSDRLDETALLADYLAPASHPLEAWGDADFPGDLHSLQQPVIRPLHATYGLIDLLVAWGAAAGAGGSVAAAAAVVAAAQQAAVAPVGTPPPAGFGAAPLNTSPGYHYVRAHWGSRLGATPGTAEFEAAWDEVLRQGFWQGPASAPKPAPLVYDVRVAATFASAVPATRTGLEVQLFPHFAHFDGRSGNNGWLHELPDPISRVTWGSWAAIAPRRFDEMGLSNGDLVGLTLAGQKVVLPAFRQAGMHPDVIGVPLGLGRTAAGVVGSGVGVNAFPMAVLEGGRAMRAGLPVELTVEGDDQPLAIPQGGDVLDRKLRPLVPLTTLAEYRANPTAGTEQEGAGPSIWPEHPVPGQRWVMAIDLSRCNGCGKCVLGCQAENNIPVVGKRGVIEGREMAWMRIDRYYDAPPKEGGWSDEVWEAPLEVVEDPVTIFEPMLCQHCENAPCESVCPFAATMRSADGINQQVYNRCVGTRYCVNNCPFKVRRYNWFEYSTEQTNPLARLLVPELKRHAALNVRFPLPLKNNPEVTVRSRGVMEKCSFCIQRVRDARSESTKNGQGGKVADGDVKTACMEACPTGAIVFGDVNDPTSRVSALVRGPRAMRLLAATNVKPSISYLTRVRNG